MHRQHACYMQLFFGEDSPRPNSYGYPLDLVLHMAKHEGKCDVTVIHHKAGRYGRLVEVVAPREAWLNGWVDLAEQLGASMMEEFDAIQARDDGSVWGIANGRAIVELYFCPENKTRLEMIQSGFVPLGHHNDREVWLRDHAVRRTLLKK